MVRTPLKKSTNPMVWQRRMLFNKGLLSLVEVVSVALVLSDFADASWSLHIWNMVIAGGIVYLISKRTRWRTEYSTKTFLILWLLLIFHQSVIWAIKTFPLDDPQLVILTLQMPLDGFTSIFIRSFVLKVLLSCLITSFFISLLIETLVKKYRGKKILLASALIICAIFNTLAIYDNIPILLYKNYLSNDNFILDESAFFKKYYISSDSVSIQNDNKNIKNLVLIIMESIENSFVDSSLGGVQQTNLIPELLPADSNEYHFSHNGFIGGGYNTIGAKNTISATVAKTTGVPVLVKHNFIDTLLEKVPSVYDYLQRFGYYNVFIQGTDANFSGTKKFVLSHGIHTLYDMYSLKEQQDLDEKYRNFRSFEAGITDRTVLEISKFILDSLSQKKHFSLTIATIETHFPYGFYNKACEDKPRDFSEQASLEATIRCASKDVRNFVNWMKQQPFYQNTEVIIVGDHLFMGDYLVDKNRKNRRWYDLFIAPAVKPLNTNREFTSFDMAPTIMESLGFSINNHKMGFGVSLFSSESTIVERIGIDSLDQELANMKKSIEYTDIIRPNKRKLD